MHFFDFAVFAEFAVEVFVEGVEMLLHLLCVEGVAGVVNRVLVDVSAEDGLGVVWFDMFSRATVAMTASANFVVKRTVYFVLFGSTQLARSEVEQYPYILARKLAIIKRSLVKQW